MKSDKIQISKKEHVRGEDGHRTFSIRIREETVAVLDHIAEESNRSRNELIHIFLRYGIENYEIIVNDEGNINGYEGRKPASDQNHDGEFQIFA